MCTFAEVYTAYDLPYSFYGEITGSRSIDIPYTVELTETELAHQTRAAVARGIS